MKVTLGAARSADLAHIFCNLRPADKQELETASGKDISECFIEARSVSELMGVAYVDDEPAVAFGVAKGGVVWLVATSAIEGAALPIFRLSKQVIQYLLTQYPTLHNLVDCRNTLHLRWLRAVGFTMGDYAMVNGQAFQRFHMHQEGTAPCAPPRL